MLKSHENFSKLLASLNLQMPDVVNTSFLNQVVGRCLERTQGLSKLPDIPIIERHPYVVDAEEFNFPTILIGTFPPISYYKDIVNGLSGPAPAIPTFHGNRGFLWNYLIGDFVFEVPDRFEAKRVIHNWLNDNEIHYSDIILYCQRKNANYSSRDADIFNIALNLPLITATFANKVIKNLYFTNSAFFSKQGMTFTMDGKVNVDRRDAFSLYLRGLQDNGYTVELNLPGTSEWFNIIHCKKQIRNLFKGKIMLNARVEMRDQTKELRFISCVSPAAATRGSVRANPCVQKYARASGHGIETAAAQLLLKVLHCVKTRQYDLLNQYNA